jgi:hypothetical protein
MKHDDGWERSGAGWRTMIFLDRLSVRLELARGPRSVRRGRRRDEPYCDGTD